MASNFVKDVFDKQTTASYDNYNQKFGPITENMHFLISLLLKTLPQNAHILCVGVGSGTEIISLARQFPNWHFTGIDPSLSMINGCREKLENEKLLNRCTLFHGYLSEFKQNTNADAALCLLVMHFIKDMEVRLNTFKEIAKQLKPNGYFINAEINTDITSPHLLTRIEGWKALHRHAGMPEENLANMPTLFKETLAVLSADATESLIRDAGFSEPISFFQALMIQAWYCQKRV